MNRMQRQKPRYLFAVSDYSKGKIDLSEPVAVNTILWCYRTGAFYHILEVLGESCTVRVKRYKFVTGKPELSGYGFMVAGVARGGKFNRKQREMLGV